MSLSPSEKARLAALVERMYRRNFRSEKGIYIIGKNPAIVRKVGRELGL